MRVDVGVKCDVSLQFWIRSAGRSSANGSASRSARVISKIEIFKIISDYSELEQGLSKAQPDHEKEQKEDGRCEKFLNAFSLGSLFSC
jgi:hypothetical protein